MLVEKLIFFFIITITHTHTHLSILHCRVTVFWVSQKPRCLEHWSVAVKGLAQRHAFGSEVGHHGWNASLSLSTGLQPTNTLPWGRGWLDHWPPEWWSACLTAWIMGHHLFANNMNIVTVLMEILKSSSAPKLLGWIYVFDEVFNVQHQWSALILLLSLAAMGAGITQ